jgi:hypothetical protein
MSNKENASFRNRWARPIASAIKPALLSAFANCKNCFVTTVISWRSRTSNEHPNARWTSSHCGSLSANLLGEPNVSRGIFAFGFATIAPPRCECRRRARVDVAHTASGAWRGALIFGRPRWVGQSLSACRGRCRRRVSTTCKSSARKSTRGRKGYRCRNMRSPRKCRALAHGNSQVHIIAR